MTNDKEQSFMNCPLCSENSERVFEAHGFWIRDCTVCKHRFAEISADENHVRQTYADDYFSGGGAGYNNYLSEQDLLIQRGIWYARKMARFAPTKGKILDVGAAAGFLLEGFKREGWRGIGIEPNAKMCDFARENFDLQIETGSLETFETDEKFDLVSMIQVVAHFYNVPKVFEKSANLLKQNGFLLIETWNRESLTARFFGKNWHEYSPPSVLHWFSPKSLAEFAKKFDLEKVAKGRPSKWISGAHAKSLLEHKLEKSVLRHSLKIVPERLNFPYPAEDLFWLLLRKK